MPYDHWLDALQSDLHDRKLKIVKKDMNAIEKHLYEKGRRDGLEEAAKVVEQKSLYVQGGGSGPILISMEQAAAAIRALKAKP